MDDNFTFSQVTKNEKAFFDVEKFSSVTTIDSRDPDIDNLVNIVENEIKERDSIQGNDCSDIPKFEEEKDKPKTFIREYLYEERKRIQDLQLKRSPKPKRIQNESITKKTRSQKGKCYTCFPRKKVLEHIIQNENGVTFHHDMCNRNMIIVTPNKHYLTFEEIPPEEIGTLFREIHLFCKSWNIVDYNVNYNQGKWQTHKHFHLKIKSYDTIIKRMRGDHFRMVSLQKKYDVKH